MLTLEEMKKLIKEMAMDKTSKGENASFTLNASCGTFGDNSEIGNLVGKKVIVRTYAAGVWFGELQEKRKNEVILKNARRLWRWKCLKGISLSEVALFGVDTAFSRICTPVPQVWLEAIEIIPVSEEAEKILSGAENAEAE